MFKEFNIHDRLISRHLINPAGRTLQEEFLKSDDEISADFNYHSFTSEEEVGKLSPEHLHGFSRRRCSDPVRLMMELEATNSLEENY